MAPQRPLSAVRMPVWVVVLLLGCAMLAIASAAVVVAVSVSSGKSREEIAEEALARDRGLARVDCRSDVQARAEVRTALTNAVATATESPDTRRALDVILEAQPPLKCVARRAPEFYEAVPATGG